MSWVSEARRRLATRVILATALSAAISAALALLVAIVAIDRLVTEHADTRLRGAASVLADELVEDREEKDGDDSVEETVADENHELVTSGIRLAAYRHGQLVAGDAWVQAVPAGQCRTSGALGARARSCGHELEGYVLVAAERSEDSTIRYIYVSAGLTALLVGALLAGATSVLLTRWALSPLRRLSRVIRGVRPDLPIPRELEHSVVTTEIEDIRAALLALLQQGRALLEQSRAFAANAAHELRTPLTTMQTELELLIEEASSSSDRLALERIHRRSRHLSDLIERLLVLASPVSAGARGETVAVADLLQEVKDALAPEAAARVDLSLPTEGLVRGDPTLLRALLSNALDNALKFSAPARVEVRLSEATTVQVDVIDAGPGVTTAEVGRVFEPFYRGLTATAPGHGLGLALIRHIAAVHGGSASFLARTTGAHLSIVLPAWQPAPSQPRQSLNP